MSDLDELGSYASRMAPRQRPAPPPPNAALQGFLAALGAAPVAVIVLVLAFLCCEKILQQQVRDRVDEMNDRLSQLERPSAVRPRNILSTP